MNYVIDEWMKNFRRTHRDYLDSRSLCFLTRKDEILLGLKKQGFGAGNWVGIGGKQEENESIEETAVREAEEEVSITPRYLRKVGHLEFYFPRADHPENWNQQATIFQTSSWTGSEKETEEILPKWFSTNAIPYDQMWDDARFWLPKLIQGNEFYGIFFFDPELKVEAYDIGELSAVEAPDPD